MRTGQPGPDVFDISLADELRRAAQRHADTPAVVWPSGSLSYRDLDRQASRFANGLAHLGLERGDRLAIVSENRVEYIVAYLGAAKMGVTVVAINIRWHPTEALQSLRDTTPRALLLSAPYEPLLDELRALLPPAMRIIHLDSRPAPDTASDVPYAHLMAAVDDHEPERRALGSDVHNILYTSGTTGVPKGAMITQRAAALRAARIAHWFGLTERDGFVGWLPLYHVAGEESLYATLVSGGRFAVLPTADPLPMFHIIEAYRLTWTILVPGTVTAFAQHPARRQHDLTSLRFAGGYGDLLTPSVLEQFTTLVGVPYYDAYGQTETSYLVAWHNTPPGLLPTLRKDPTPLLALRLVDDQMADVPDGAVGELVVRGPTLMSGYWHNAEATAEVFRGGWLHTGDLLRRHPDGRLAFVDRKKALIKTGGENVYPAEVERVLAQLPGVVEVCVVGLPDPEWGERVHAVLVLEEGARLTPEAVEAACLRELARYKRPRSLTLLSASPLPRSTTGKVQRDAVRDQVIRAAADAHA